MNSLWSQGETGIGTKTFKICCRFELPDFSNQQRWMNRVVNNLLYFQTNYLLSFLLAFTLATLLSPGKMLLGLVAIAIKSEKHTLKSDFLVSQFPLDCSSFPNQR